MTRRGLRFIPDFTGVKIWNEPQPCCFAGKEMVIMKKALRHPLALFALGALLGVLSKLLDIYAQNLGNIFSQLSIWILLGVGISVFSETMKRAAVNVFLFCIGMLITYYLTAELTGSVYSGTFIYGWTAFSLLSPAFACLAWLTKRPGVFSGVISAGILAVTLAASIVLFDGPRIYDWIILAVLFFLLFSQRRRA